MNGHIIYYRRLFIRVPSWDLTNGLVLWMSPIGIFDGPQPIGCWMSQMVSPAWNHSIFHRLELSPVKLSDVQF